MYLEGLRRRAQATPRGGMWMRRRMRLPRNGAGTGPPEMQVLGAAEAEAAASGSTVAISASSSDISQSSSTLGVGFAFAKSSWAVSHAPRRLLNPLLWPVSQRGPFTFTPAFWAIWWPVPSLLLLLVSAQHRPLLGPSPSSRPRSSLPHLSSS